uniref:RING-type domain-containing protein n=1 Tax=Malurus cyaneus samueli TaxID=2593467 RepID=A0A8C5UDR1_9PASS
MEVGNYKDILFNECLCLFPSKSHVAMGQGVGKTAWPKPTAGYQTVTGGRCGRRHSYVGFRPFLSNQDRDGHQQNEDCKQLELEDVQKKNSSSFTESSGTLVQVSPDLLDEPLSKDAGNREPVCQNASSQTSEVNTSPFSVFCYGPEGSQISRDFMNPYENSVDLAGYTYGGHNGLNGKNGIAFVNIDSYELDSSDGEEEDAQEKYSWIREAAGLIQGRLDNISSQCEKEVDSLQDLKTQLSSFSHSTCRESCEEAGPMPLACLNNRTLKSADEAIPKISLSGASYETRQIKHVVDVGIGTPIPTADVLNVSDGETDKEDSSELVVRPKIRKQNTAKQLERENHLPSDDEELSDSWRKIGIAHVQQCHPECPLRDGKEEMSSGVFFLSRMHSGEKNTEIDLRRNAVAQEQNSVLRDSAFWNEFEDHNRHCLMSPKDEDRDQTLLEEGEISWLPYREEVESSSDEENDPISDFVHLGFFLLDGNNNLEDDSSVSEDLDVEWRLLDEFGDGLGLAQAIPHMESQFLTFMALEGRLEAVETALAQLESLTFDVEQTHPPATKETIDCLPQMFVTGDHNGQEQCCTICCSEYVEGEIITELPCRHLFHKPCVTLWLQRVSTTGLKKKIPPKEPDALEV